MPVEQSQKPELLAGVLQRRGADRVLVFTRTKMRADMLETILTRMGIKVGVMHADRTQGARQAALEDFRAGKMEVLIATDIVARGIDISDISHVINYDVPENPEDYVHRIGRTGRAGASGYALTFVGPDEIVQLREIEYMLGKNLPIEDLEGFEYRAGRIIPFEGRPTTKKKRIGLRRQGQREPAREPPNLAHGYCVLRIGSPSPTIAASLARPAPVDVTVTSAAYPGGSAITLGVDWLHESERISRHHSTPGFRAGGG